MQQIVDWVISLMATLGPVGAGIGILLENLFPPIPSEVILPLTGFTAAQGHMNLYAAIIATTLGSVTGAWLLYGLGAWLGAERLKAIARRMPLVDENDVDKVNSWFNRHGAAAVFFGRFVPGIRSIISIPAGIARMPLLRFTLYTAVGSLIWNTVLIMAGWVLGDRWEQVGSFLDTYKYFFYALIVAVVVWWVVRRIRRDRHRTDSPELATADETPGGSHAVRVNVDETADER